MGFIGSEQRRTESSDVLYPAPSAIGAHELPTFSRTTLYDVSISFRSSLGIVYVVTAVCGHGSILQVAAAERDEPACRCPPVYVHIYHARHQSPLRSPGSTCLTPSISPASARGARSLDHSKKPTTPPPPPEKAMIISGTFGKINPSISIAPTLELFNATRSPLAKAIQPSPVQRLNLKIVWYPNPVYAAHTSLSNNAIPP
ncbi:hypothetical protein B0H11DRAFT_2383136, partial [Mycena galericulata]